MATAEAPTVSRNNEIWVLVAAIMASSTAFISSSALNVALPALQRDLGVTGRELLWVVNAYMLFLSALILVGGSLGDHYGRKRIFGIGIGIFTAASVVCGLVTTPTLLILGRAVQGVGGALMVPGSLAIISATFPEDRRGRAIGTWSTFGTMTTVLGPVIGGWLAGQGLWRVVFFINVPLSLIAFYALTRIPESYDVNAPKQLDWPGVLLTTLGLAGITYGFTEAPTRGFDDPLILATLIGGIGALIAFVIVEARSDHPIVPLGLFKSRTFSGTNLLTLFLYGALGAVLTFLPLNLIQVQGYSEEIAGLTLMPFTIILTLMSRWAGGLIDRVGARLPLTIGPALAGVGLLLMAVPGMTGGSADYWFTFFPAIVVMSIGMGVTVAPLTTAVMGSAPQENAGTASGINNAVARTAGVLAVAILGALALVSFRTTLDARTADIALSDDARATLMANAVDLGATQPPENLDATTTDAVRTSINGAFVDVFRIISVIGGVLCLLSAAVAWLLVEGRTHTSQDYAHIAQPAGNFPCEGRNLSPDLRSATAEGSASD